MQGTQEITLDNSSIEITDEMREAYRRGVLPPEIEEKRRERLDKLQAWSDQALATKKRRRRTRGWAGLPADPPAPPRFPSETTLDEGKAILRMENTLYQDIRKQFQTICEEAGFLKKTEAGPERWQGAKDRLVAESLHLDRQFNGPWDGVTKENKALALDVICTDVTKRMRTLGLKITLADAKNTLGINPEQSREIRNKFYDILIADHFTGKQETGDAHWKDLQQQWINNSQLLQDILAPGDTDPQHHQKLTAVNVLSRDVMKRLRDDQNRKNPAGKKQLNIGPGPGPANPKAKKNLDGAEVTPKRSPAKKGRPTGASTRWLATSSKADASARARTTPQAKKPPAPTSQKNNGSDLGQSQIDPSLLAAANDPSYAEQQLQDYAASASSPSHDLPFPYAPATQFPPQDSQAQQPSPKRSGPATAVWFRNAESSAALFGDPGKTWMGLLRDTSMHGLKQTALKNAQSYRINRIWGVVKDPDSGEEINMGLSSDAELSGYMEFLKDTDSTAAVFLVEVL